MSNWLTNIFPFVNSANFQRHLYRFDHNDQVVSIYNDQTIADAVHVLWKKKVCAVAVVKRQTEKLIGCVRVSDIHRLLADDRIFTDREYVLLFLSVTGYWLPVTSYQFTNSV